MADRHVLDPDELAERAARNAKRAAVFTAFCVLIAAVILALDHGIKKAILEATDDARKTVDQFQALARVENAVIAGVAQEVRDGAAQTGEARASTSAADGADSGVGDDSGTRTPAPADAAGSRRAAGRGKTGVRPGP